MELTLTLAKPRRRKEKAEGEASIEFRAHALAIPRLSRQMALAIGLQQLVASGASRDYADLARLGYVSRARMSQIMNLLNLAPDIQEEILDLRAEDYDVRRMSERHLRPLAAMVEWGRQRQWWSVWKGQHGRKRNFEQRPNR